MVKFVVLPIYLTSFLFGVSAGIAEMTPSARGDKLGEGLAYGAVEVIAEVTKVLFKAASQSGEGE
jgi:hypothetical protein